MPPKMVKMVNFTSSRLKNNKMANSRAAWTLALCLGNPWIWEMTEPQVSESQSQGSPPLPAPSRPESMRYLPNRRVLGLVSARDVLADGAQQVGQHSFCRSGDRSSSSCRGGLDDTCVRLLEHAQGSGWGMSLLTAIEEDKHRGHQALEHRPLGNRYPSPAPTATSPVLLVPHI